MNQFAKQCAVENTGASEEYHFFPFPFFFNCFDLLLSTKKDARHIKTIKESQLAIPSSLGTRYSATVKIFTSLGSRRWKDWHRAAYFVTAGLPFWSPPHFSQGHLSRCRRAEFHMCVFELVSLLTLGTGAWTSRCNLLTAVRTRGGKMVSTKKELTDFRLNQEYQPSQLSWYVCLRLSFFHRNVV